MERACYVAGRGVIATVLISTALVTLLTGCQQKAASESSPTNSLLRSIEKPKIGEGPFGLSLNTKLEELDVDEAKSQPEKGIYVLNTVPEPNSEFELYAVSFYDGAGLCRIIGITPDQNNDETGSSIRGVMDKLAAALKSKYGPYENFDFCGDQVVCEPRFWSMALQQGHRRYAYSWEKPKSSLRINNILLDAVGSDGISTSARLVYEVGARDACYTAQDKAEANSL